MGPQIGTKQRDLVERPLSNFESKPFRRADRTGASGDRLKEGANINKSLSTLGSVLQKRRLVAKHSISDLKIGKAS